MTNQAWQGQIAYRVVPVAICNCMHGFKVAIGPAYYLNGCQKAEIIINRVQSVFSVYCGPICIIV